MRRCSELSQYVVNTCKKGVRKQKCVVAIETNDPYHGVPYGIIMVKEGCDRSTMSMRCVMLLSVFCHYECVT
jgi:hypothetical protein